MVKTLLAGSLGAFLGLAGAGAAPVVLTIFGATGGAVAIVGLGVWRAIRRRRSEREG